MVIDCQWSGDYCNSILSITPATQQYDTVTFAGKPANYIDTNRANLQISDFVLNYFPPALFTVFPNLNNFYLQNCQKISLAANPILSCSQMQQFYIFNTKIRPKATKNKLFTIEML